MAVDELEIEGFKPLKSLKFDEDDLGMVNVITGRNNTGKSSILEAIDLLYNPSHVDNFSSHVGDLINKDMMKSVVSEIDNSLVLRSPTEEEITEYGTQIMLELFSDIHITDEDKYIRAELHEVFYQRDPDGIYQVSEIDERKTETIQRVTDQDIPAILNKNLLIIEIDAEHYPYFDLSKDLFWDLFDIFSEKLSELAVEEVEDIDEYGFELGVSSPPSSGKEFFLDEPTDTGKAKLIKTPVTDVSDYEPESEKDAVKIDDIEDYITERGLVDNLKDFDLDYLVFEEDGEKDSVPFNFMGDGFKSMVGVLWELVEDDESEIVMIEEPENHMHPGYVQEMFDFLVTMAREDDIQLFITTHSIDFINYMFDENLPEEHRDFLEDELSVIRMESPELAAVFDYEEAQKNSEELHLDLRGI